MASESFVTSKAPASDLVPALRLRPRLLKAYVNGIAAAKAAVVVLEVEFIKPDGASSLRVFRGQNASMNWFSSVAEVSGSLRDAMSAVVSDLRADIEVRLK